MKRIKSLPTWLLLALGILALGLIGAAVGRQLGHDVPAAVALERPAFLDDETQTDLVGERVCLELCVTTFQR